MEVGARARAELGAAVPVTAGRCVREVALDLTAATVQEVGVVVPARVALVAGLTLAAGGGSSTAHHLDEGGGGVVGVAWESGGVSRARQVRAG